MHMLLTYKFSWDVVWFYLCIMSHSVNGKKGLYYTSPLLFQNYDERHVRFEKEVLESDTNKMHVRPSEC